MLLPILAASVAAACSAAEVAARSAVISLRMSSILRRIDEICTPIRANIRQNAHQKTF